MRIRGPQDLLAGLSLVAISLFALWASWDLDAGSLRAMGPGMLPRATAGLLGACGLALTILGLVKHGQPATVPAWRAPFFVCLAVVAFALTIRTVGLVVAGPLVTLISGGASPETRPRELVVFAVVMTAFCVGLFKYALGLPIPILILPGIVTI